LRYIINLFFSAEAIIYSDIDPLKWKEGGKEKYDPILDWTLPPKEVIDSAIENSVKQLRNIHSPVFFSTDKAGKRWMGLSKLPREQGPLLFVANHQFSKSVESTVTVVERREPLTICYFLCLLQLA
jgi:hypothetical protein